MKNITITTLIPLIISIGLYAQPEPSLAWAKTVSSSGTSGAGMVTSDNEGNIYVLGILGNASLTIGGTTVSATNSKAILIKYDSNGNGIWIREIPFVFPIYANTHPHKFIFHNGKLYLFNSYDQNNIVMDGFSFPPRPAQIGIGNLVLIQMDAQDGTAQWIRTIARPNGFQSNPIDGFEIYFDQQDQIHALGVFSPIMIFDNGDTLTNMGNPTGIDAFHAVYDTLGDLKSANRLGVINTNITLSAYEYFHMDNQKNIYRYVRDTKTFIKYNEQGDILFTKTFTQVGGLTITGMTVDPWQNVFLSGYFTSATLTFDNFSTSKTGGNTDGLLVKFNSNDGIVEWLKNQGAPECDAFQYINGDEIGNIYVLSPTFGSCSGAVASLLVKYNDEGEKIWEKKIENFPGGNPNLFPIIGASNISLSPDGGTIIVTGRTQFSPNDQRGFIAQYGICNTPQPTLTVSNTQFCTGDSILLSVTETPGYNYLWSNGDTTNTSIYVTSSGKYSVVAIQAEECYAQSEEFYITEHSFPDNTITEDNNTLTATETTQGTNYQWLDCNNEYAPVNGENTNSFNPVQNGSYSVEITSPYGCIDTSVCITINSVGINEIGSAEFAEVYPNPATEEINIQSSFDIQAVRILDLQGKELIQIKGNKVTVFSLSSGVYIIEITTPKGIGTKKFIKE